MTDQDQRIIDAVRQRALLADRERKALMAQRRELDATISALAEVTDLSRSEIEKISADVKRDVYQEGGAQGRKPTVLGLVAAVVISWGVLSLAPDRDSAEVRASVPARAASPHAPAASIATGAPAASPRPASRAAAPAASGAPDTQRIPGLTAESEVHVFGVYEGTLKPEDAARVRAERDAVTHALAGRGSSLSSSEGLSLHRRWTSIEEPPGRVTVHVRGSTHPVILVLSAYESVYWHVVAAPGTVIEHVILSGYEEQFVSGLADEVPTTAYSPVTGNRLRHYCYKKHDACYAKLEQEIARLTGKQVAQFRGAYRGETFRADYRAAAPIAPAPRVEIAEHPAGEAAAPADAPGEAEASPPAQTIHKWVDEVGRVHYGDRPPGAR